MDYICVKAVIFSFFVGIFIMKSLLEVIPYVINDDPQLARNILNLEHYFVCSLVVLYQRKRKREESEKEREKQEEMPPPPKKTRRFWVRPYLQRRKVHGQYDTLMPELSPKKYKNFLRMDETIFQELVERVRPIIQKQSTNWREPINVGLRLAITLRFLATGDSYRTLAYAFLVAPNTISSIVPETCRAIVAVLGDEVLKMPNTPEGWREVAKGFEDRWNLPHCIGAIDGKHIRIRNPAHAGSLYFNYKKFFSIVLLAVVDSDYKFRFVDVGACGSESDAGIYAQSHLAQMLQNNAANLPPAEPIQGEPTGRPTEYFLVGDDAFALRTYLMKPFPDRGLNVVERVYNYRLTRARRVVENAFGILASR